MQINVITGTIHDYTTDTILIFLFEDVPNVDVNFQINNINTALRGALGAMFELGDFSGKSDEVAVVYTNRLIPASRVIMVGLGKSEELTLEAIRRAAAQGLQKAREVKSSHVAGVLPGIYHQRGFVSAAEVAQAVSEGGSLGLYQYHGQKTSDAPEDLPQVFDIIIDEMDESVAVERGVAAGQAYAAGAILTRELVNLPPNICNAPYLAERVVGLGHETGLYVEVLGEQQIRALKMEALLAVNRGSETPPRFVIIEHNREKADELDTIVLVGKGVTFDTGGYSLKSVEGIVGMKADMGGAAAVVGAMQIVSQLHVPLHVVGLLPISDNMISGRAYRPQEVIMASNGKTIEVISTDAEGRLLLADALVYAGRYKPAAVVDIATLTGACIVALGTAAAGLFSNDDTLRDRLVAAGDSTHERVWPMPLYPEYAKAIESDTADIKNSGGR
ncbi:MAG: leucyl aminopeptidase, partial [Phototrophicales bacterium]